MIRALRRLSGRNLVPTAMFRESLQESTVIENRSIRCIYLYHKAFKEKTDNCQTIEKPMTPSDEAIRTTSSNDESSNSNNGQDDHEKTVRKKILEASLNFVAQHGWTKAAIMAGAESIGYPGIVGEMFPLGGADLVLHFYSMCNERLRQYLEKKAEEEDQIEKTDKRESVKAFVYDAVEKRLRMIIPFIDKWPQALATLTLSRAVPTALSNLLTLVDDICYYSGDRSIDFDWYVRRIALAGIYKVTELYMLQDKSPDYEETWKFLKKQLDDASAVYSCVLQSEQASQLTKEISLATFTTARNILGLNWNR